ncbi:uncharacterized protein LOC128248029 [Octopus bimaculoides]|uniref:uncharacterized protein LOC128248029 n=1 Tax=Octopus bimaculoides TaxID=37653 RepID=UPI0022E4AB9A|nr:uncharacterized protein LOC128248029 [Octopus bimaculoides]
MWYFPGVECKDFIEHLTNLTNKTFPELHLREDLNFTSYDDFQMTLVNMTNVISQYNASIQSQLDRELDYLCAPAKELGVPCYYPNACFQGTFRNDATFFCHLRNANSLLKDLKLLLTQMVTTHSFENTTIDNDLLVKSDIPLVWSRWFSMVTLYHLQNLLNQVDNKLRLKF